MIKNIDAGRYPFRLIVYLASQALTQKNINENKVAGDRILLTEKKWSGKLRFFEYTIDDIMPYSL